MTPTLMILLVIYAFYQGVRGKALHWFMLLSLFGGQAALLLTAAGGANLSPAVCYLPLLLAVAWRHAGWQGLSASLSAGQAAAWLGLLVLWGCVSAAFLPRLLEGAITVFTTDRSAGNLSVMAVYLKPVSTNITQSFYAVGSFFSFVALSVLLRLPNALAQFRNAVLTLAVWNAVAAGLNLVELYGHIWTPLTFVRSMSGYAVIDASAVGALGRITGTFPESSSFAAFTSGLFVFCFALWRAGVERRRSGWLALLCFALLVLSTSTTAYAGLGIYMFLLFGAWSARALLNWRHAKLGVLAWIVWAALVALCIAALFKPEWLQAVYNYVDMTVLRKMESSSGMERGAWNARAWQNFLDSYGLGIGLGSARASSYPLVLLSNMGVLGAALFLAFLMRLTYDAWSSKAEPADGATVRAAWHVLMMGMVSAALSATVFDLGLAFYGFAAAAGACVRWPRVGPVPTQRVVPG